MTEPQQQWTIAYLDVPEIQSKFMFDVVGESYCRDGLMGHIRNSTPDERQEGEIYKMADLVFEPTNEFDPNAIAVYMHGPRVGYIPRSSGDAVGAVMRKAYAMGANRILVWAVIGWDTNNPQPPIGVKLNLPIFDMNTTVISFTEIDKPIGY